MGECEINRRSSAKRTAHRLGKLRARAARCAISVGILLGLLLILELIAWAWVRIADIPTEFRAEPFQGFGQSDPVLWWTLQPQRDIESQGVSVRTNRFGFRDTREELPDQALRIFCIGDSTTFGWRVEADEMYTAQVECSLRQELGRPVAVVSAGVPGYTSYQALVQFREKILPLRPDVVCVLSSNNECRARSMGDRQRGQRIANKMAVHRWLKFSHLWIVLSRTPESLRSSWELDPPPGRVANTEDEYRQNLSELSELARAHNCRLVFLTVPLRLRFEPTWPIHDPEDERIAELIRRAQRARFNGESVERQEELLLQVVRIQPRQFNAHWRLAQLYLDAERGSDADRHFALARDGDLHPEAAKPAYNRVLHRLCTDQSVILVDLDRHFIESPWRADVLFFDHCHPSVVGHQTIARALSQELIRLLRTSSR